ncbi:MAG: hypothetical protein AAF317_11260, partial [Pseudomonadota bacterium]
RSGLEVRADLITFLHLGLEITKVSERVAMGPLLASLGINVAADRPVTLPFRLPYHFPEVQARVLRDTLIAHGLVVDLIDDAEDLG